MKTIFLFFFLSLCVFNSFAQDFSFGQITSDDFNFDRNKLDSNANAVVLKEFGTSRININDDTGQSELVFIYHVKIKIYNKEGYGQANILIPTYKNGSREETVSEIRAATFNSVNGKFVETAMDKKAIFSENKSKYVTLTKFTLPNIQDGSVIEYSFSLESPRIFNFRTWEFQTDIPKVYSEYLVFIPAIYNYNVSLRGYYKLSDTKTEVSKECLRINGVPIDCSKITYIMKNIPAFIEEEYMTAPSNFKSAIYFELTDWQMPDGRRQSYTKTWKDVDYELKTEKTLGKQMKRDELFKDLMPSILKNTDDDLSKAKAIYEYIKKQVKWNRYYGIYSEDNIKKALSLHSGDVADVNLSLIAALSAANLDAEAVILSTRENGKPNNLYPVISDFNYLIAKVNIGDKSYLIDATEPLLPFGLLPLRCLNDKGRVINLKKPSYWIDLTTKQKSTVTYSMDAKLGADGKITGNIVTNSTGYEAFSTRTEIKKYSSPDEYVEKLDERLPNLKILKHEIRNIDSVENILTEIYQIEMSPMANSGNGELNFNPFFINPIRKNPFNLTERTYPVDLGFPSYQRINLNITLPGDFELAEKPKDMAIGLPNSGGKYLLQTQMINNMLSVSQILEFSDAIYEADQYPYLKEFYSRIIQNQKADVQLKKIN
ncbi:DUF3857 domain-containing protein [Pedobacter sp. UYP30]|uniref:DUF3857 domain-containing protein n=1 Tax=Pedobacter sp. UYP30 TaxID=1756400 RepID=UPI0033938903